MLDKVAVGSSGESLLTVRDHDPRGNNFDLVRLLAAFFVMAAHSYLYVGQRSPVDFWLGSYVSGGDWGVAIFFVISGYLVTKSIMHRTVESYLISRALRIFPGLIVLVLLTVFVLGPLVTTLPLESYFSNAETYRYLYTATVFEIQGTLPGVFGIGPIGSLVNGSLWTLPGELTLYLLLPLLLIAKALRPLAVGLLFVACLSGYLLMRYWFGFTNAGPVYLVSEGLPLFPASTWTTLFLAGAFLYLARGYVVMNGGVAFVMFILLLICWEGAVRMVSYHIALPYLVIYLGTRNRLNIPGLSKLGDISYGFYIYALPIQQTLIYKFGIKEPVTLLLVAAPIITVIAAASWQFIEKPALGLKNRHGIG